MYRPTALADKIMRNGHKIIKADKIGQKSAVGTTRYYKTQKYINKHKT